MTFTPPTVSDVPLLFPIRIVVPAATTRVISFPDEFLAVAVNLRIDNEDAANAATYRYGGARFIIKKFSGFIVMAAPLVN